jgi:glycosyltransferase involved in cell wall biosynthesis
VLDRLKPELLILRTPMRPLLRWARVHRVRTLALLADSFYQHGIRARLSRLLLARELNAPNVEVVANHGRNACRQLVTMGVGADKVVPWDYPAADTPHAHEPKQAPSPGRKILFVGAVSVAKGVEDLVRAVELIPDVTLDIIGSGAAIAAPKVNCLGLRPNREIIASMREADVVVVPSRHEYPEGIPLTIYEAFCSRTPLVLSDHPMFVGNAVHGDSAMFFKAGDVEDLACQISRVLDEPELYGRLSRGGLEAWERLQVPVVWHELIERWLAEDLAWIRERSLARTTAAPGSANPAGDGSPGKAKTSSPVADDDNRPSRTRDPAPIYYVAVAGNAAECLKIWSEGKEDERSLAVTYSSQFFESCRRLGRRGIVSFPGEAGQELAARGMAAYPRPYRKMRSGLLFHLQRVRAGLRLLARILRSGASDVILMDGVTYFICVAPARLFGVRLYMSFHTELYDPRSRVHRAVWRVDGWAMRNHCSGYLAVSPVVAEQIRAVTRNSAAPIFNFHGTYSPALFAGFQAKEAAGSPFRVYFGGRIEREKGVFDLLEIADRLALDGYEVIFDVCGTGGGIGELRRLVSARRLGDRVHVHGDCSRDKLLHYLQACDAVIVPTRTSFREGLSKALAEAALSCRPAVTSEVCLRGARLDELCTGERQRRRVR